MAVVTEIPVDRTPHGGWVPNAASNGVGVPGGIPSGGWTEVVATGLDPTGVTDCQASLIAQGTALGPNQVLKIPAGTYNAWPEFAGNNRKSNFAVRGTKDANGVPLTIFKKTAGRAGMGTTADYTWEQPGANGYVTNTTVLTKGQTVIPIVNTTGFLEGQFVRIAFANDYSIPVVSVKGIDGVRTHLSRLVSKTSTTLVIDPPLLDDFSGVSYAIAAYSTQIVEYCGFEDFILDMLVSSSTIGLTVDQVYAGWLKNVWLKNTKNYHAIISDCLNFEILGGSYLDLQPPKLANHFGIAVNGCTRGLFWDITLYNAFPGFQLNRGTIGCAFAYFFADDAGGKAVNSNHSPHNSLNLYEGFIASSMQNDGYFGSSHADTVFRAWLRGFEVTLASPVGAFVPNRFSNEQTLIGNVFNSPGTTSADGVVGVGNPNLGNSSFDGEADLGLGDPQVDLNLTGTVASLIDYTFTADPADDSILIPELVSSLAEASRIQLQVTSGAAPLSSGIYYVIPLGLPFPGQGGYENLGLVRVKLAATQADAYTNTAINITSAGSGLVKRLACTISMPGGIGQLRADGGTFGNETQSAFIEWNKVQFSRSGRDNNSVAAISGTTITIRPWQVTSGDLLPDVGTAVRIWSGVSGFQELDGMVLRTMVRKENYTFKTTGNAFDTLIAPSDTLAPSALFPTGQPHWWPSGKAFPPINSRDLGTLTLSGLPAAERFIANDPPVFSGAVIGPSGNQLSVSFSKPVTAGADGFTGFDIDAPDLSVTYVSGGGTATLVFNVVGRVVLEQEVLKLNFAAPADGAKAVNNSIALSSFSDRPITVNSTQSGGASYYIGVEQSDTLADYVNPFEGQALLVPITVPEGGIITRLRVFVKSYVNENPVKIALFSSSGALLGNSSGVINTGGNRWYSFAIGSVAVNANDVVRVGVEFFGNNDPTLRIVTGLASGSGLYFATSHAAFPPSTLPALTNQTSKLALGALLVPSPPVVPAPTNLTATAVSSSQINLAWVDNANNETGFRIEQKTGAGGLWNEIYTAAANATSYSVTGLSPSTQYYFRVEAFSGGSDSAYSNEANATTSPTGTLSRRRSARFPRKSILVTG